MKTNSIDPQNNREALTATVAEWVVNRWPELTTEELQSNLPLLLQIKKNDEACRNCADPALCRTKARWNAELRDGRLRGFTEACRRTIVATARTNACNFSGESWTRCIVSPPQQVQAPSRRIITERRGQCRITRFVAADMAGIE